MAWFLFGLPNQNAWILLFVFWEQLGLYMTNELCTSWLSLCPSQLSLLCMCQLDVCFHLCVLPAAYTKPWARLAYATSSFPVVISVMLFPGHIGLIFDPLPGGASACESLLWPALPPTLSSSEHSQVLPFLCSVLSVHCSFYFTPLCQLLKWFRGRPPSPRLDFLWGICNKNIVLNEDLPEMISLFTFFKTCDLGDLEFRVRVGKNLNLGVVVLRKSVTVRYWGTPSFSFHILLQFITKMICVSLPKPSYFWSWRESSVLRMCTAH